MQDVSYEPLMLWLSENLSSKLGYFQPAPPSPLLGSCIYRKAINKNKPPVLWRTATSPGQNGLFLFIALARMVTFCKEGGGMLSVRALRARSYKTKAEV